MTFLSTSCAGPAVGRAARRGVVHRDRRPAGPRAGGRDRRRRRPGSTRRAPRPGVGGWKACSVVVCPPRFNALLDAAGTKGAVLAHALAELLRASRRLAARRRIADVSHRQARRPQHLHGPAPARLRRRLRAAAARRDVGQRLPRPRPGPRGAADVPAAGRRRAFLRGPGVDGQQVPARAADGGVQPLLAGAVRRA